MNVKSKSKPKNSQGKDQDLTDCTDLSEPETEDVVNSIEWDMEIAERHVASARVPVLAKLVRTYLVSLLVVTLLVVAMFAFGMNIFCYVVAYVVFSISKIE